LCGPKLAPQKRFPWQNCRSYLITRKKQSGWRLTVGAKNNPAAKPLQVLMINKFTISVSFWQAPAAAPAAQGGQEEGENNFDCRQGT